MGCHTWFSVPFITDKEKIKEDALTEVNRTEYPYSDQLKKMYTYAINEDLDEIISELAIHKYHDAGHCSELDGMIYMDASDYELYQYNLKNGTTLHKYKNHKEVNALMLDGWHDCFRCSGYPTTVLRSYDEVLKFIDEYEFLCDDGVTRIKCSVYKTDTYDGLARTKEFFDKYPNGVVRFG